MYCIQCGADAPTEVGAEVSPTGDDEASLEQRRLSLQSALGQNFTVARLVGRGGFGEVWAAFDVELRRTVAIKVLRQELISTPGFRERFRREARAVAKLRHPGIVPIYHVGEAPGLVYFIMPLVEGITLKTALEEHGRLTPDEAMRILVEASSALREAHRRGIVHRDLKPENVMLEGAERHVLLMDFGIAQTEDMQDKALTGADMVLGSPEYMSPEQATGKRQLDGRSDIYSLGVVAYRMLAGKLPFDAETARELLIKHVTTPPEPLEGIPAGLAEAVMRCLAKQPDDRWQTTDEFVSALSGEPVGRGRGSSMATLASLPVREAGHQATRRRWRRITVTGVALSALAAGIIGAAVWQVQRWRAREQRAAMGHSLVSAYRGATDTLRTFATRFTSGALSAARYLVVQESLSNGLDRRLERTFGPLDADLASLPDEAREDVESAMDDLWLAGFTTARLELRSGDAPGCALKRSVVAVTLRDDNRSGNCWYPLAAAPPPIASPVEYFVTFSLTGAVRGDAGFGLAWCAGAATCRVAFLWSGSRLEWGMLRAGSNLQTVELGRRLPALTGVHHLRVREQGGAMRIWLDGTVVLERASVDDAGFLGDPSSLRVVVQNAEVHLPAGEAMGFVGGRRP